jgi:hypothetical protein
MYEHSGAGATQVNPGSEVELERHARHLTRIDSTSSRSFSEFSSFDLTVDQRTTVALEQLCHDIADSDIVLA